MKQSFWNKRIPTFFGLFLTLISVIITSHLANNRTIFETKASPATMPENIRVTNVFDSSFAVSYTTKENVIGTISFGKNQNMGNSAIDYKDKTTNIVVPRKTHYITLNNLEPNTKYFFVIVSKDKTYSNNNLPFDATTAQSFGSKVSPTGKKITGQVILPDGQFPNEGVVYLTGENIQPLSAVLKSNGKYEFDIESARNQNLSTYFQSSNSDVLSVNIISETLESNIKILSNIDYIPITILSKNYDFTIADENESTKDATSAGFPVFSIKSASNALTILSPKNNETFVDQKPLFRGTGKPGSIIKITINSNEKIETQVEVDGLGNWTYRPKTNLPPGNHTITIVTADEKNSLTIISRSFTVFASGFQVMESATPSATPTFTPSPTKKPTSTPIPTPIPTAIPTIPPTIIPTSTPTPTELPIPTSIPTPTTKISPPTKPPGDFSGIIVGSIGFGTILIGMLLFLFNRSRVV